jgi:membrane-associated phospholipid phosphatase
VPSLHVSYPLMIALFGWPVLRWPGRTFVVAFLVTMCVAAVYLDHHWIIDVLLGLAYALGVYALVMTVARSRSRALSPVATDDAREVAP